MASQCTGGSSARTFAERQSELFGEGFSFSGHERDLLVLNQGERGFLDVSGVSGADSVGDGRGSVFADLDNDGDLDIFLRAVHGPAHILLRNNIGGVEGMRAPSAIAIVPDDPDTAEFENSKVFVGSLGLRCAFNIYTISSVVLPGSIA